MAEKLVIGLIFVALTITTGVGIYAFEKSQSQGIDESNSLEFTLEQLAEYNGKSSKQCYIAIDSNVYEIQDSDLWLNGQHTTSSGQAMCGVDLTNVINSSPHGRTKLQSSKVVKIGVLK